MAGEGEEYRDKVKEMGAEIRAKRESLGLSLDDIQRETRIRSKFLLAVEEGNEAVAPGATYFRAFLKTYATFLGLDGPRYSLAYQEIIDRRAAPASHDRPRPQKPGTEGTAAPRTAADRQPAAGVASDKRPASGPHLRPEKPATTTEASRPRPHRTARRPRRGLSPAFWGFILLFAIAVTVYVVVIRTEPPASTVTPPDTVTPPVSEPETKPEPKVTRTNPDQGTVVITVDRSPVELTIKAAQGADAFCWLRLSADGKMIAEKTLGPGQEEKVSAESEIVVRAGKPWVISLVVNGKDLGVAGEFGPVKDITVRSVQN